MLFPTFRASSAISGSYFSVRAELVEARLSVPALRQAQGERFRFNTRCSKLPISKKVGAGSRPAPSGGCAEGRSGTGLAQKLKRTPAE